MNRFVVRSLLVLVFVIIVMPAVVSAQPVLTCAADTLMGRIGCYHNGTTNVIDCGVVPWRTDGDTYNNIQCISLHGLLEATKKLNDPSYALASFDTANLTIGRYIGNATRPYASEVDYLMEICAFDESNFPLESNSGYCTEAQNLYSRVVGAFTPEGNADRYIDQRLSLAGWDIALHIRSAWRAGYESYARAMVHRTLARRADWEHVLYGGYDYTTLSWGGLVRSILNMCGAGDLDTASCTEALGIMEQLRALQMPDGSWDHDYQTSAYALLALRADSTHYPQWHQNITGAEMYLEGSATAGPTCGWVYVGDGEYVETDSEVIMALSLSTPTPPLPFANDFETGDMSQWSWVGSEPVLPLELADAQRRPEVHPIR